MNNDNYIYHLIDPRTGAVRYVGVGRGIRMWQHVEQTIKGNTLQNPKKYRWINKMLLAGVPIYHKRVAINLTREQAYELECRQIEKFGFKQLTNLRSGGCGGSIGGSTHPMFGRKFSDEHRRRISEAQRGKTLSNERRALLSQSAKLRTGEKNPFYGRHHTPEALKKMAEAKRGRYVGENNPMFGKHRTEAEKRTLSEATRKAWEHGVFPRHRKLSEIAKEKIGNANRGRIPSAETRCRMSAARLGKRHSLESRKKMSEVKRAYWLSKRESVL